MFIDVDHHFEQVYRDIINSLVYLKENGIIVMHDCNPPEEIYQREIRETPCWTGTVWKAFVKMRQETEDIEMFVIDTDWGIGILNPSGKQELFECSENIYDYDVFAKYRKQALKLMNKEKWEEINLEQI